MDLRRERVCVCVCLCVRTYVHTCVLERERLKLIISCLQISSTVQATTISGNQGPSTNSMYHDTLLLVGLSE